jgi:CheY-like chemotaxis protein
MAQPKPLDLNALIDDAAAMLRRLIGEGIEVRIDFEREPWPVMADGGQMHQVVMNLAVNARDAMANQGLLTVRTSNVSFRTDSAGKPPELSAGDYVCLTVSDTGTGMDAKTRERIFEPFFTTKPDGAGTGLGLAMVYAIIQQCGGCVSVESQPGEGSTFFIYLPRTDGLVEKISASPAPPMKGSETILLVEYQDDVRGYVSKLLRRSGYNVIEARAGAEARPTAHSRHHDVGHHHARARARWQTNSRAPIQVCRRCSCRAIATSWWVRRGCWTKGSPTSRSRSARRNCRPRSGRCSATRGTEGLPGAVVS